MHVFKVVATCAVQTPKNLKSSYMNAEIILGWIETGLKTDWTVAEYGSFS